MWYEFTFVVKGVGPDDDDVVTALAEHLDAMLARAAGVVLLTIATDGSDAIDAARNAVLSAKFHAPQIEFLHLDRDLVGISEIAQRVGRSRQNVTQWISGERHASRALEPFPHAEGVVGRARVWLWADVNAWLPQLGLGDDTPGPSRDEMTDIDYMLRHQRLLTLHRPAPEPVWPTAYVRRVQVSDNGITVSPTYGASVAAHLAHHYAAADDLIRVYVARTSEDFVQEPATRPSDEALTAFTWA